MTKPTSLTGQSTYGYARALFVWGVPTLCLTVAGLACSTDDGGDHAQTKNLTAVGPGDDDDDTAGDDDDDDDDNGDGSKLDIGSQGDDDDDDGEDGDEDAAKKVDILFVIDNSGSMGEEQHNLAGNFPLLIQQLRALMEGDESANVDVNILVTTTDLGHTACAETTPEFGDAVTSGCNERIDSFEAWGDIPDAKAACTDVCEEDVGIRDDRPYIWFRGTSDNVEDVDDDDVNGDGVDDGPVAQALACIGPQGIDGCGFESPLEGMMQVIDPDAPHNQIDEPFIREDALLAIAFLTDEADCSVDEKANPDLFDKEGDKDQWETNPDTDKKGLTSAICWNAGADCDDNGDGTYDCTSKEDELRPLNRYKDYLNWLIDKKEKNVVMLAIVGIPEVTKHNEFPPFEPLEGGIFDLEYRDWIDDLYPDGDILPNDWNADPRRGADVQKYTFGIGPGCTGGTDPDFTGQAIPPVRIREVCESLNREPDDDNEDGSIRCCMESICDDDFSPAIKCLTGLIDIVEPPQ